MFRETRLYADFTIEGGAIEFDVQNGDGTNCEALADLFIEGEAGAEVTRKPEHGQAQTVGQRGRRATE